MPDIEQLRQQWDRQYSVVLMLQQELVYEQQMLDILWQQIIELESEDE